jgi:hypothetical protein
VKTTTKKKTLSGVEWDGFQYTDYSLNSKILDYTFTVHENSEESEQPLHAILKRFREEPFESVSHFGDAVKVEMQGERRVDFGGTSFSAYLLEVLLNQQKAGVSPFEARWFYYDKVYCLQDNMHGYKFFVAYKDAIVDEQVRLVDHSGSGFDPGAFDTSDSEYGPIWSDERDAEEAIAAYWYRKFYTETKTGQLYVLSPILRPFKTEAEMARETLAAMVTGLGSKLSALLCLVIILLALIAIRLWFR